MLTPKYSYYTFDYADIILEGYGNDTRDSSKLIKAIITVKSKPDFPQVELTIDRHQCPQ